MNIATSLAIITLAALIHASFQVSVSVLTLLNGHAIGKKRSQRTTIGLTASFVAGAGIMTLLLLSFLALTFSYFFDGPTAPQLIWAIACGLLIGVGTAVWFFYYRKGQGTALWVPRSLAHHLSNRSKATKDGAEAFSLGLTSVISELLFTIAPLTISALVLVQLPDVWQIVGILLYSGVSLVTLFSIWVALSSGHRMSVIQKWREENKHFLQFSAGSALIILGLFVYVCKIVSDTVGISA